MQPQYGTDFTPLLRSAGPAGESFERTDRFRRWRGDGPSGNLGAQPIEKIDESFEVVIHHNLNAREMGSCKIS